ncbi:hypothetical protein GPL17_05055 [Bradyrhizobium yuanmingense]|nr:hypothetical protein [Bradyrhizobium yuanmingense]
MRAQRLVRRSLGEGGSNPESLRGGSLDCFVARTPRNDGVNGLLSHHAQAARGERRRPPSPACHTTPVLPDGANAHFRNPEFPKTPTISALSLLCMGLFSHFVF